MTSSIWSFGAAYTVPHHVLLGPPTVGVAVGVLDEAGAAVGVPVVAAVAAAVGVAVGIAVGVRVLASVGTCPGT